jgi:hypothetical protein
MFTGRLVRKVSAAATPNMRNDMCLANDANPGNRRQIYPAMISS